MLQCEHCKEWFHGDCVGVHKEEIQNILVFVCPACTKNPECPYRETLLQPNYFMAAWTVKRVLRWFEDLDLSSKSLNILKKLQLTGSMLHGLQAAELGALGVTIKDAENIEDAVKAYELYCH
jgi:hypothetical protein